MVTGAPYIAGIAGTPGAGWFTDQYSNPRLWVATETWGLPARAGEWNSGNWQLDYDTFFSERAAQGCTVTMCDPFPSSADTFLAAPYLNGNTWDNVSPWTNGTDAGGGLKSAFWTRIDYMLNSALASGITIGFTLNTYHDGYQAAGTPFAGWSTTQFQAYGAAVGARYSSALQPNIVWLFGNDSEESSPSPGDPDNIWSAFLTGLTGAGATQPRAAWWQAEYTSRYTLDTSSACGWGISYSQFNFVYTYNANYFGIEYAYGEVANEGASALLPVIWGDGYWFQGESTYDSTQDRSWRQEIWWALAAGARGILAESNNVFAWGSTALAAVTTDWGFVHSLPHITSYYAGLPQWWNLLPDLSSALVTAGRGTRVTSEVSGGSGAQYENSFANGWVAASKTPDGTLAVCYLPLHTTITVNTALLATGWAATWVDPISAATSSAGAGPAFNSTAKGTNSQGDPDWALVFQAP